MSAVELHIPGWYGKIPNLGDFGSRRLPLRFVAVWDDWLQRAIAASQTMLGEEWRSIYLTSPLWRFLCMPGVCGDSTWSGIVMPSVDRIGRYFPLTIATELTAFSAREASWHALSGWLGDIERVALATLDIAHTPEDLDTALRTVPMPDLAPDEEVPAELHRIVGEKLLIPTPRLCGAALPAIEALPSVLGGIAGQMLKEAALGKTIWWSRNKEGLTPLLLCCNGLPPHDDFVVLLAGTTEASAPH